MTDKQKQCLLCYLGYYGGAIDGIWGPLSAAALEKFQQAHDLGAEKGFTQKTREALLAAVSGAQEDWWADIRWFDRREFACKCGSFCDGYPAEMSRTLVETADRIRERLGAAAVISSGIRCEKHNANVGGVANSRHLTGRAMDFRVAGKNSGELLAVVREQSQVRYAYAIDGSFVHMDVE